jgi:CIC family chloride channel protein
MKLTFQSKLWRSYRKTELISTGKILIYSIIVGIIAGLGAIVFTTLVHFFCTYVLGGIAGYSIYHPAGEPPIFEEIKKPFNPFLLILITTCGGLLSGIIVYTLAPETEGAGTDAAIEAYHQKRGIIKTVVPFIKMIASAITLGTGGSGGNQGPIAQIGAGFGSVLAKGFKLSETERRILLSAGMGAGIGAIFRSPLAGAIFASEVLYKDLELEHEVLFPSFIASIVAYSTFAMRFGWSPLFSTTDFKFSNPLELIPYTVLAVAVSLFVCFYVKVFYCVRDIFHKIHIKPHFKPAIGGFFVGIIGIVMPQAICIGFGTLQLAMWGKIAFITLFLIAFLKIFATAFTISSGGSAGVFGPSMVIGGTLGGTVGGFFHYILPTIIQQPGAFVLVGMAGFFTAAANTPLSTIIMIVEMTRSHELIVPVMWVSVISYFISRKWTIYEKQVENRGYSSVHRYEFVRHALASVKIKDVVRTDFKTIIESTPLRKIFSILSSEKLDDIPIVNKKGELTGIITLHDIKAVLDSPEVSKILVAKDVANLNPITITPHESLHDALHKIGFKEINTLPVVDKKDKTKIIGIIRRKDITKIYNEIVEKIKS